MLCTLSANEVEQLENERRHKLLVVDGGHVDRPIDSTRGATRFEQMQVAHIGEHARADDRRGNRADAEARLRLGAVAVLRGRLGGGGALVSEQSAERAAEDARAARAEHCGRVGPGRVLSDGRRGRVLGAGCGALALDRLALATAVRAAAFAILRRGRGQRGAERSQERDETARVTRE